MSFVARLTFTNSSLSSLPIYVMGLFLLADDTHAGLINTSEDFSGKGWEIKGSTTRLVGWRFVARKSGWSWSDKFDVWIIPSLPNGFGAYY